MSREFIESSKKLEQWIRGSALPFWKARGMDGDGSGHVERLDEHGNPDWTANIRMRVQSRQLFVFSYAHHLGWDESAEDTVASLLKFADEQRSDVSFPHLFDPKFNVIDSRKDIYDYAFHILAYTWCYRAFKNESALVFAKRLVGFLDQEFKSVNGGWVEGDFSSSYRRQNPHMHLLEAFLALFGATEDEYWLERAAEIVELFKRHFYDSESNLLLENFNADWSVCEEPHKCYVEPGHMMEWVWLLNDFSALSGRDCSEYCVRMLESVNKYGFASSGLLYDRIGVDRRPFMRTKRCWPMTEAVKGCVSQAVGPNSVELSQAANHIDVLFKYFICEELEGGYIDQRDSQDRVLDGKMPASTLYHLIVASAEASSVRNRFFPD
ncbi:AGE family epimerase/isomerase [Arenicella sp. 4NH20-0111]|uniref:AGE family epimerase/isomerase n=1 Tax=Arenicella sp. 4NH20-0111 TaxID=3127648 RepID=UPI00310919FE